MIRRPKGLWETMKGTGLPWSLGGLPPPLLDVYGRGQSRDTSVFGELTGMPPVARGHEQGGKREQVQNPNWDKLMPEQKLKKLTAITSEANRRARREVLGRERAVASRE